MPGSRSSSDSSTPAEAAPPSADDSAGSTEKTNSSAPWWKLGGRRASAPPPPTMALTDANAVNDGRTDSSPPSTTTDAKATEAAEPTERDGPRALESDIPWQSWPDPGPDCPTEPNSGPSTTTTTDAEAREEAEATESNRRSNDGPWWQLQRRASTGRIDAIDNRGGRIGGGGRPAKENDRGRVDGRGRDERRGRALGDSKKQWWSFREGGGGDERTDGRQRKMQILECDVARSDTASTRITFQDHNQSWWSLESSKAGSANEDSVGSLLSKSNRVMRPRTSMCVDDEGQVVESCYPVEEDDVFVDDDGQFIQTYSHDALGDEPSKNTVPSVNDDFDAVGRLFDTSPKEGEESARDVSVVSADALTGGDFVHPVGEGGALDSNNVVDDSDKPLIVWDPDLLCKVEDSGMGCVISMPKEGCRPDDDDVSSIASSEHSGRIPLLRRNFLRGRRRTVAADESSDFDGFGWGARNGPATEELGNKPGEFTPFRRSSSEGMGTVPKETVPPEESAGFDSFGWNARDEGSRDEPIVRRPRERRTVTASKGIGWNISKRWSNDELTNGRKEIPKKASANFVSFGWNASEGQASDEPDDREEPDSDVKGVEPDSDQLKASSDRTGRRRREGARKSIGFGWGISKRWSNDEMEKTRNRALSIDKSSDDKPNHANPNKVETDSDRPNAPSTETGSRPREVPPLEKSSDEQPMDMRAMAKPSAAESSRFGGFRRSITKRWSGDEVNDRPSVEPNTDTKKEEETSQDPRATFEGFVRDITERYSKDELLFETMEVGLSIPSRKTDADISTTDENDGAPSEGDVSAKKTDDGSLTGGGDGPTSEEASARPSDGDNANPDRLKRRAAFAGQGSSPASENDAGGPDRLNRQTGFFKMLGFRRLSQDEMDEDLSHQLEAKILADQDARCEAVVEEARRIMDDVNKSTTAMGLEAPFRPVDETFPPMRKLHTNIGCQMDELEAATGLPHAESREALRQKKSKERSIAASSLTSSLGKDHAASLRSSFGSAISTSSGPSPQLNNQDALAASVLDQITSMKLREDDVGPSLAKLHTSYLPNFMWYQPVAADSSPAGMMRPTALCSGTGISDRHCLDPDMLNVLSTFGPYLLGSEHLFQGENDDDTENDATGNKRRLAFWVEPIDENEAQSDSVGEGAGGGDVNSECSIIVDSDDSVGCGMSWLRR